MTNRLIVRYSVESEQEAQLKSNLKEYLKNKGVALFGVLQLIICAVLMLIFTYNNKIFIISYTVAIISIIINIIIALYRKHRK